MGGGSRQPPVTAGQARPVVYFCFVGLPCAVRPAAAPHSEHAQVAACVAQRAHERIRLLTHAAAAVVRFQVEELRPGDFKMITMLGRGNGGSVLKVVHAPTNLILARKVCKGKEFLPRNAP